MHEEQLISDSAGGQLIFKSGPVKPKLESLSLCQWSMANLAIMNKLLSTAALAQSQVLDYLSYTMRVYHLISSCNMVSVFFFDREYRRHQHQHDFRWGTDIPHLHSVYLRPKPISHSSKPQAPGPKYSGRQQQFSHSYASHTPIGREICKKYNSRKGCHLSNCRFEYVCSVPGCAAKHQVFFHPKN